ncbi:LamB/YcsF family protein [Rhodobacteraceae bacterium]|nr:LamB/YcsF family protein [Paracoccaceae bacterium]
MQKTIDLNADMGESFGPWKMGNDAALLDIVSSANIACGFHAGDPDTMAQTMALAAQKGVGIGAHPGFQDLQGFGRRRLKLSDTELANMITYQLGAAQAMAKRLGTKVRHLKLHGAMSNMASEDAQMARICYQAALDVDPDLIIMVLSGTAMETVVQDLGCAWAGEIFADRAYNADATLVARGTPGAMISDPKIAADRILDMLEKGGIVAQTGEVIPCRIDTICLHGDGDTAVPMAQNLRAHLEAAGYAIRQF